MLRSDKHNTLTELKERQTERQRVMKADTNEAKSQINIQTDRSIHIRT